MKLRRYCSVLTSTFKVTRNQCVLRCAVWLFFKYNTETTASSIHCLKEHFLKMLDERRPTLIVLSQVLQPSTSVFTTTASGGLVSEL